MKDMNQLTKLIEKYKKKTGESETYTVTGLRHEQYQEWTANFVLWLADQIEFLASRQTCGKGHIEAEKQEIIDDLSEQIELEGDQFEDSRSWSEQIGVILSVKQAKMLVECLSRPTCGLEQRKFLDEVEKYGHFIKRNQSIGFALNDDYDIDKVIRGE